MFCSRKTHVGDLSRVCKGEVVGLLYAGPYQGLSLYYHLICAELAAGGDVRSLAEPRHPISTGTGPGLDVVCLTMCWSIGP